jgi:large conductance mechanosensitive channel
MTIRGCKQAISRCFQNKKAEMGFVSEFKEFAIKGNVIDLAVGVIIGSAFSKIVDSVVSDLFMPLLGALFGKLDFSSWFIILGTAPTSVSMTLAELKKAGVPVFAYGNFLTVSINFLLLAFVIFLMIKQINRIKRSSVPLDVTPVESAEIKLLREIRDQLKIR